MSVEAQTEGNDAMNVELELSEIIHGSEFETSGSTVTRKLIMQYLSAGILFPEEIRHAEQILRHLNSKR